ncbi:hypothetical protein EU527_03280 [Candidatus Thorarchaeota archaeon]|nr:MAG: hypothetical protein EU527_03280 [Candidatus Thorarchaeota archaeon]
MGELSDIPQISDTMGILKENIFWIKLVLGLAFGASSYFFLRFNRYLTWYILAPILYLVTSLIVFVYLYKKQMNFGAIEMKKLARFGLNYTGTWIIAYFVLATAVFYFGW